MDQIASITDTNLTETQFYNRVDEINMLSSLLGSTEFNSSPTILLTGIRGVGKTALIKKIKDKEWERQHSSKKSKINLIRNIW